MEIRRVTDPREVEAARALFGGAAFPVAIDRFLTGPNHHLLIAYDGDEPLGMVTGVEMACPDKGTEMFLYDLNIAESGRRRGVGRALIAALARLARERGCCGTRLLGERDSAATWAADARTPAHRDDEDATILLSWPFSDPDQSPSVGVN